MSKKIDLLIIDPQVDFCDPAGALAVPGADADMQRLTALLKRIGSQLHNIYVSLDSHYCLDISHPLYWQNTAGEHPAPFTTITLTDVETGKWRTTLPELAFRSLAYLKALEANARYPLVVWPYHCLLGSPGHTVYPPLFEELIAWEKNNLKPVTYILKGINRYTEHYSVIQADVPDADDPATQPNLELVRHLGQADQVLIAGEAGSHCLANTVRDLAACFHETHYIMKLTLLTDATSPVTNFEYLQEDFVEELMMQGMQLAGTTEFRVD